MPLQAGLLESFRVATPVCRSQASMLSRYGAREQAHAVSQADMNDPDFVFTFQVLISNPTTAFDPDGKLRVFFGGFSDDLQGTRT